MRWFGGLALALFVVSPFLIATQPGNAAETSAGNDDVHAAADLYAFMVEVAKPAAEAKIAGDQNFDKAFTLSRDEKGEVVVTSLEVLGENVKPTVVDGTIALALVHYRGQCEVPYGSDDSYVIARNLTVFVIGVSGRFWEIGKVHGAISIREVKGADTFGPWEQYQTDPVNYVTYRCGS